MITNYKLSQSIQRALVLAIALATITVMSGIGSLGSTATAQTVTTSSTRIVDGSLIRAHNDIDIYIVKIVGSKLFKRLILNPTIFESYGHLRWEDVISVSPATLNQYRTSDLVREVYPDGSIVPPGRVYRLYPQGDTGVKRWVNITQAQFEANFDRDSIYGINATEAGPAFYAEGPALTASDLGLGTSTPTTPPAVPTPTPPTVPTTPTNPDVPTVVPDPDSGRDGDEGTLEMSTTSRDIEDALGPGEQGVVLAALLESVDSDIEIQRVDVTFMGEDGKDTRVWKTFDRIRLLLDGQVIASRSNLDGDDFVDAGNDGHRLRFAGLEEIIDEDTEQRLEVEVTVESNLTSRRTGQDWTVSLKENAIRGVDEAGIQVYGNTTADEMFEVSDQVTDGLSAMESSEDVGDRVRVSTSEDTDGIMVFNIDFENKEGAPEATLQEIEIALVGSPDAQWDDDGTAGQDLKRFIDKVSVYLGNTELDSVMVDDGTVTRRPTDENTVTVTLNSLDVDFDADETRTLTVKVDVGEFTTGNENGVVTPYLVSYVYEYGNDDEESVQYKDEDGTTGKDPFAPNTAASYFLAGDAVTFTALSPVVMEKSATLKANGEAMFTIDISAPEDNDVYLTYQASGCADTLFTVSNTGTAFRPSETNCAVDTDAEEVIVGGGTALTHWKVAAGETETFTITAYIHAGGNAAGFLGKAMVTVLAWGTLNDDGSAVVAGTRLTNLDIETPRVYVVGS